MVGNVDGIDCSERVHGMALYNTEMNVRDDYQARHCRHRSEHDYDAHVK